MLTAITADQSASIADLGFIPSLGLQADIVRFRDMRAAWNDMVAAALDFDTDRYDLARARFSAAKEGC